MIFIILFSMIICHILADYNFQGNLANFKQKLYWTKYSKKYRDDWIIALILHSFFWSFSILIPYIVYYIYYHHNLTIIIITIIVNTIIHSIVDDLKCNRFKLNLTQDQLLHLIQIIITWFICIC